MPKFSETQTTRETDLVRGNVGTPEVTLHRKYISEGTDTLDFTVQRVQHGRNKK